MRRRHDELAAKYATPSGGVAVGKMTPAELKDYMAEEQILAQAEIFGDVALPKACHLDKLPDPAGFTGDDPAGVASHSKILADAGPWQFVALQTLTMLPVPKGWEVDEAGYDTFFFFPPVEWTVTGTKRHVKIADAMMMKITYRQGLSGIDQAYKDNTAQALQMGGPTVIAIGTKHDLGKGAGYFFAQAKKTQAITVMICVPVPGAEKNCDLAVITMGHDKWPKAAPILTAMFQQWYDLKGHQLLPDVKFEMTDDEAKSMGFAAPATKPAAADHGK